MFLLAASVAQSRRSALAALSHRSFGTIISSSFPFSLSTEEIDKVTALQMYVKALQDQGYISK
jgi:hypothetical protein